VEAVAADDALDVGSVDVEVFVFNDSVVDVDDVFLEDVNGAFSATKSNALSDSAMAFADDNLVLSTVCTGFLASTLFLFCHLADSLTT